MPIDDAAMAAAIDTGIAAAAPPPTPTSSEPVGGSSNGDTDTAPDTSGSADHVDDSADSGDGSSAAQDGSEAAGEGEGESQPSGEGTPAADTPEAAAEKAAAAAKPDTSAKVPDPLNDPLPNALKRETKERINTLIGMVKEKDTKLQTIERDHTELVGYIRETGATPQQYSQALSYLKLVNSPDPADREKALEFMQGELQALARMLGKPVPGVNLLDGHPDLIQEVGSGRLSPDRANELAAARERAKYENRRGHEQQQQANTQAEINRAINEGKASLNALEQQLRADPHYAAKRPILIAQLKPVLARIHPSEWAGAFRRAYDALPATVVAPRPTPPPAPPVTQTAPNVPKNTPLSGRNPAGGAAPAPKTLEEAIDFGLSQAR